LSADSLYDNADGSWTGITVTAADHLTKVEGAATYLQTNDVDNVTIVLDATGRSRRHRT
jgi:hypothetical protein